MRLSRFHLRTEKEIPAEAEIISHKLMLKAGMLRKLGAGLYTWSPLGLRVLRKVEAIVREEMDRAGAIELLMPTVQPRELWEETGRWDKFGGQLLKMRDRKDADYCYAPTAEEVITDFARQELASYKQLPVNFYQIQTKFRDEIRPRFGALRAREFIMKDAYSFHADAQSLSEGYQAMYDAYCRIFTRLGLRFRAVNADTGAIGGTASHEFHVLADSGEDSIAFSDGSDYAANMELAEALAPAGRAAANEQRRDVETPTQRTCEAVAELMQIPLERTVKSLALIGKNADGADEFIVALVRGDHDANPIKLAKVAGLSEYRMASEAEIADCLGTEPGFIGPLDAKKPIRVIADRSVAAMADFVVGANRPGMHIAGVNFGRDLAEPEIADLRNVVTGDASPDGQGTLGIARGIEVGHVFALGDRYSRAMNCTVLGVEGRPLHPMMGCYGIGVSRIVAAAIEQNHDQAGIRWPQAMAPWAVAICIINPGNDPALDSAASNLQQALGEAGIESVLDDRGLRPGAMFADIELIGIPHRVVVSARGLESDTFEYRRRDRQDIQSLALPELLAAIIQAQSPANNVNSAAENTH